MVVFFWDTLLFEPVIRNPDDKEMKYFRLFLDRQCGQHNMGKGPVQSYPMLIFLSGNRPLVLALCLCFVISLIVKSIWQICKFTHGKKWRHDS